MKTKVGVLRGGPSEEYEISMKTGRNVLRELSKSNDFSPIDILITKDGIWHIDGIPQSYEQALQKVDVAFNALHGAYGEDGQVQKILETFGTPYTGSTSFSSLLSFNKPLAKDHFKNHGIKTPYYKIVVAEKEDTPESIATSLFRTFPMPAIIKPLSSGSSIGIIVAHNFEELFYAIDEVLKNSNQIFIEEYIVGKEATAGVIENFRNQDHYELLPIEIILNYDRHFTTAAKQGGDYEFRTPGNFTNEEKRLLAEAAKVAHKILGLRHYSASDFIITPSRGIYLLEVDALPSLHEHAIFPKSLEASGSSLSEFLHHIICETISKK